MTRFHVVLLLTAASVVGLLVTLRVAVGARPEPPPNILHVARLRFAALPTPTRGMDARLPAVHGLPVLGPATAADRSR